MKNRTSCDTTTTYYRQSLRKSQYMQGIRMNVDLSGLRRQSSIRLGNGRSKRYKATLEDKQVRQT